MFKPVIAVLGISILLSGLGFVRYSDAQENKKELQADKADALRFVLSPFFPNVPFQVDSVASDGSVRIHVQVSERMAQNLARQEMSPAVGAAMVFPLTEGYFLGLSGLPESDRGMVFRGILRGTMAIDNVIAFRAQVMQVEEQGKAVIRIGPAAVEHLKKGDTFFLIRPSGSSTAQLLAVPDTLPITDARQPGPGMDPSATVRLNQSINNLKQIALAMHNFHDTRKHFPPAVIYGPDGKPWHSWRVLLLPYLEQMSLYRQYRFDEPWDGPNNKQLLEKMPSVYRDPIYGETEDVYTHYAVAVGEGTGFPPEGHTLPDSVTERSWRGGRRPAGSRWMADFRDGTSNTLLIGSVSPKRKIPWMKPEDVVFDERFPGLGKEQGFAAPYKTDKNSGGVFAFADGHVRTIRDDIDIALLRNLIQIADGHPIGDFPSLQPVRRSRSQQVLVLEISRGDPDAVAKLTFKNLRSAEGRVPAVPGAPPTPAASEAARKVQSMNHLKQLGLAIHNYLDVHKQFPPACSTNEEGNPLLSWRVLVLPYLGQQALYQQFRLDEPWDGEHNKGLIAKMPPMLRSTNSKAEPGMTNYLGVSGPQGIFPGQERIGFRDVTDGTSNTIMIVEASDQSAVIWTKPDDFVPDSKNPMKGLPGLWKGGFYGGFADCSVRFLNEAIDDKTFQAMLTRNGGELVRVGRVGTQHIEPRPPIRVTPSSPPARPAPRSPVASAVPSRAQAIAEMKKLGGKFLTKGFKSSWSPDGTRIVFGRKAPDTARDDVGGLGIVDVETGKVTELVAPGKDPAWSPGDGKLIAYVTGYGNAEELWIVEATGGKPRKLADGGFPTWSSDGTTLFFQSRRKRKLMAVQVDAEKPEPTELMDMLWWYPAISPDAKQVAYRLGSQLLVADMESGKVLKKWRFPGNGRGFLGEWSRDGKQIGFGGYGGTDAVGLWVADPQAGRGPRLTTGLLTMPSWSRDGSKIALDLRAREGNEIWMIDAGALEKLESKDMGIERYAVPTGGVDRLLEFIQELRTFRPRTSQQHAEHRQKASAALKGAAEKILKLEKDEWSEAYQTALRVLFEARISTIRKATPDGQQQTIEFVKIFLTGKLEKEIESADVSLAMSAAKALEYTGNQQLAAEAYRSFAELLAKSENENISARARIMAGAARRLMLLGKEMELEGTTFDGMDFDWAAYRGKTVLVDFWATWCGPCRVELPNVRKYYELYHDQGFDVVGISLDRNRKALEDFLEKEKLPWITLYDEEESGSNPIATYYGVMAIPTVILVDMNGKVVSLKARGGELGRLLKEYLGPVDEEKLRRIEERMQQEAKKAVPAAAPAQFTKPDPQATIGEGNSLYLTCGPVRGPGKVYQVNERGLVLGCVDLPGTPYGIDIRGKGLVVAIPRRGVMSIAEDGSISPISLGSIRTALDVAADPQTGDLIVADNREDILVRLFSKTGEQPKRILDIQSTEHHLQDMAVAATTDSHVLFATNEPEGVYRLPFETAMSLGQPVIVQNGDVAADRSSNRWAAMTRSVGIQIFDKDKEVATVSYPEGQSPYRGGIVAFGQDGTLAAAFSSRGGVELAQVDLEAETCRTLFRWGRERLVDFAVGPRTEWAGSSATKVANAAGDELTFVAFNPPLPHVFKSGERLTVKFTYKLASAEGCRLFVRPLTGGQKTPGYGAHGSPLHSRGTGEVEGWFSLSKPGRIDQVRVEMVTSEASQRSSMNLFIEGQPVSVASSPTISFFRAIMRPRRWSLPFPGGLVLCTLGSSCETFTDRLKLNRSFGCPFAQNQEQRR